MVVADSVLFSVFYTFGVILLITKCIRGFWFHILELVPLNYPLPFQGFHPAGKSLAPTVDCRVVARAVRIVAAACLGPWRPMRFGCRPLSCPSIALIFISHQEKKMQKGKGNSTGLETANWLKKGGGKEGGKR